MIRLTFFICVALTLLGMSTFKSLDEILLPTEQKVIHDLCFSKHGTTLLVADGTSIRWFSTDSYKLLGISANGHRRQLLTIDLSADSSLLVSGGKDSTIVLWNVKENKILKRLKFHNGIVTSVKISSDNNYLISGGTDHKVFVYDLREQKVRYEISDHKDDVTSVEFNPNSKMFCTAGADGNLNFYDVETGELISSFHKLGFLREVDFSQDGSKIISCGDQSNVNVWRINQRNEIEQSEVIQINNGWLFTSKINEDNKSIVTSGAQGIIRIETILTYVRRKRVAVADIEFKPKNAPFFTIAVATLGKGVYVLDAKEMAFK